MSIHTMNEAAIRNVYLFIAELNGYKVGTENEKVQFGIDCFKSLKLPEATPDDLYEVIWLERLYHELTCLFLHHEVTGSYEGFHWSVPIELDATALA